MTPASKTRRPLISRRARLVFQTVAFVALFTSACLYSWAFIRNGPGSAGLRGQSAGTLTATQSPFHQTRRKLLVAANASCPLTGGELTLVGTISGQTCCEDLKSSCCSDLDSWYGVIFYFAVVLYTFLGLAIICDDYFCESLEMISEALSLSDDVAGATFMAAGSSAPELFTAVVTTLIIEGSEGLGTIVGSAIFNIMIIVGVTAICAGQTLQIWWYPLTRDCVVYVISVIAMGAVVADFRVDWYEGVALVVCYGGYIALMVYNGQITDWIESRSTKVTPAPSAAVTKSFSQLPSANTPVTDNDVSAAAAALAAAAAKGGGGPLRNPFVMHASQQNLHHPSGDAPVAPLSSLSKASFSEATVKALSAPSSRHNTLAPLAQTPPPEERKAGESPGPGTPNSTSSVRALLGGGGAAKAATKAAAPVAKPKPKRGINPLLKSVNRRSANPETDAERRKKRAALNVGTLLKVHSAKSILLRRLRAKQSARLAAAGGAKAGGAKAGGASKAGAALGAFGAKPAGGGGLMAKLAASAAKEEEPPKQEDNDDGDSISDKILWVASLPYIAIFKVSVPDCRTPRWKKWYMLTFTMSIFWIGVLSFLMVDFAARAGCVLQVPGILMGLVVIAAGTSVPDALSSVLVAKNGQGDMAVANVLGSNVFNIFLGLGLPWMLKSLTNDLKPIILPANENIIVPIIILLGYVVVFVGCIAFNGWQLTKQLGYVFIAAHGLFVVWSLLTMLENPVISI